MSEGTGIYELPEEHEELRAAVRALAEKDIAPHAADVDEQERYPSEAQQALTRSGFHAIHISDAYGGEGADAVAACMSSRRSPGSTRPPR